MIHDLLMPTPAKQLEAKAWGKEWRCWCFSHASPGCACPRTLCEPPLLPTPSSSDSWEHLPGFSEPEFFTAPSFSSSRLLSPSAHSAFQALLQKIFATFLPEHHRPLRCGRGFCMLAAHFELCSGTFVGLPPFPLPLQSHPWPQPPIPHPCHARQACVATQSSSSASGEHCSLLL